MDEEGLEYSPHARKKMSDEAIFEEDVEGAVDWPTRRQRSFYGRIKHFGYSSDGRLINVDTDNTERYVITVIDLMKRPRKRGRRRK
jgi:hypothetical protein